MPIIGLYPSARISQHRPEKANFPITRKHRFPTVLNLPRSKGLNSQQGNLPTFFSTDVMVILHSIEIEYTCRFSVIVLKN